MFSRSWSGSPLRCCFVAFGLLGLIDLKPRIAVETFIRMCAWRDGPVASFVCPRSHLIPRNITQGRLTARAEPQIRLWTRNICH